MIALIGFLMTPLSLPVWHIVTPLKFLQFPFRFLTIALLPFACFAGILFYNPASRRGIVTLWAMLLILQSMIIMLYAPHTHGNHIAGYYSAKGYHSA